MFIKHCRPLSAMRFCSLAVSSPKVLFWGPVSATQTELKNLTTGKD
jgi:hypothetical protein